ncbi:MAG: hypothetical protein AAGG51_04585 [Cyanobacteria bacterium P01_G01_bin.54]
MGRTLREVISALPQSHQDEIKQKTEEFILENKLYEQYPELLEKVSPEARAKLQIPSSLSPERSA